MTRFDVSRGIDFMAYAKPRMRGAVFNGLRSYLAEYARRENPGRMRDRLDSFDFNPGEDPLEQIVSTVAGLGVGFLLDSSVAVSVYQSEHDPSLVAERHQMDRLMEEAIAALPDREKLVMILHYQQHVPFVEIAALLRVTKGRVSQIHRSAVERMRDVIHSTPVNSQVA